MYRNQEDVFYYLTLENENYVQPKMPNAVEDGIVMGMYKLVEGNQTDNPKVQLLASGALVNEVIEASILLKDDWNIDSDIWSVTSYSELHREAEDKSRWNILHPQETAKTSYVGSCMQPENGPVIAISDYVKLVAEQIAPYIECPFVALGTDGFGRSETRDELRRFFEVNRYYIVMTALDALSRENKIDKSQIKAAIEKYQIDPEKPNPVTV